MSRSSILAEFRPDVDPEQALRALFCKLSGASSPVARHDLNSRDIVATPFAGNYGFAGLVVALNGSPPRGLFLVTKETFTTGGIGVTYVFQGKSRQIHSEPTRGVVLGYVRSLGYDSDGKVAGVAS